MPRPRGDERLTDRLALSAATTEGAHLATGDFREWLAERGRANEFHVERIPFDRLNGWSFEETTGNLTHRSGRFFTVEGLHVTERDGPYGDGPYADWYQPIIKQPE
ncbi:NDP-hexose 2,3-dehydratase family protein, partial [Streptomyces sp. MCAF7]